MKKNILIFYICLFLCCVCTGCGRSKETNKELNLAIGGSPQTIDPQLCTDTNAATVISFMTANLYTYNEKKETVPCLAEGYDLSEDGRTYTFHLKEGLKWSDGSPLTAEDFVCGFQRLADPDVGSGSVFLITDACTIKNAKEINRGELPVNMLGVSSPDDLTFVVELETPCPYFINLLVKENFTPCDCDFYHSMGDNYAKNAESCLSSGPYVLDRYEPLAAQIHFSKNPYYAYADDIVLPGVTLQVVPNQQQALMCFDTGRVDVTSVSGDFLELAEGDEQLHVYPLALLYFMVMNQKSNPALQNRNIRMALSKSIDRDSLVRNVLRKGYSSMTRVVPKDFYIEKNGHDFAEDSSQFDALAGYDPSEARRLWEEGLKELGVDSVSLLLVYTSGESNVMEAVSAQLENTLPGLTIEKKTVSFKQRSQTEKAGEYDLMPYGWVADYADPTAFLGQFISTAYSSAYNNPEYDELYAMAQNEEFIHDLEKRDEVMHRAEEYLIEDMGTIPIYTQGQARLVKKNVKGYQLTAVGGTCIVPAISKEVEK